MNIRQYGSRLCAEPRTFWIGLTWVLFMIFFTYTDIWVAMVSTDQTLAVEFRKLHIRSVSLLVNFGLVVMLCFDYTSKYKTLHRAFLWVVLAGMLLSLFIYLHCRSVTSGTHTTLCLPFNWENLSLILFVLLMTILFVLKTLVEFSPPLRVSEGVTQ